MSVALLYNAILLVADLVFLFTVWRRRKSWEIILVLTACLLTAAVAGVVVGTHMFEALALYCYAIFVHCVLCLVALGAMSWGANRRAAIALVSLAALLLGVGIDAFLIEPQWLEVSRVEIRSEKVERPVRIVAIADLQTDLIGAYEERVLATAMAERPDLILLLGDYVQESGERRLQLIKELRTLFEKVGLRAPLGVFAVRGNIDSGGWTDAFRDLPMTPIEQTRRIETGVLTITGLSLADSGDRALRIEGTPRFQITMGHRPDFALGHIDSDLILAGHTHGGQVRIPFFGPIMTLSNVPRQWASGVTRFEGDRTLIVSRGVGMERGGAPEIRFLCRPELVVVTIVPGRSGLIG